MDCLYNVEIPESGLFCVLYLSQIVTWYNELKYLLDLEMVLNSLISIIILSQEEKASKQVTTFCENIVKAPLPEKYGIIKLRM